ncbi:MAG TPA: hypothetical protein VMZ91_14340 [Candidatus Paceibacterota bacterium]|nr:hypothetical protein [Candidatus Paceibacterota bacterium]
MTLYKTIFSNIDTDVFGPFETFSLGVYNINDYGTIKIDTSKISSMREDMFCNIKIEEVVFIEFVSYMIKRKNVFLEKSERFSHYKESICKKLIESGKIKSFKINEGFVIFENVEIKIISMENSDLFIIPLF